MRKPAGGALRRRGGTGPGGSCAWRGRRSRRRARSRGRRAVAQAPGHHVLDHVVPPDAHRRHRVAATDEHLSDQRRREETVRDDAGRSTTAAARARRDRRTRRGSRRARRRRGWRGASRSDNAPSRRSVDASPYAMSSRGTGGAEALDELRAVTTITTKVSRTAATSFSRVWRATGALHEPAVRRDLVRTVDGEVERVERVERPRRADPGRAPPTRCAVTWRRSATSQPRVRERVEEVGDGRAGAEPDAHAVVDELRGGDRRRRCFSPAAAVVRAPIRPRRRRRRGRSTGRATDATGGDGGVPGAQACASASRFSAPVTSHTSRSARARARVGQRHAAVRPGRAGSTRRAGPPTSSTGSPGTSEAVWPSGPEPEVHRRRSVPGSAAAYAAAAASRSAVDHAHRLDAHVDGAERGAQVGEVPRGVARRARRARRPGRA